MTSPVAVAHIKVQERPPGFFSVLTITPHSSFIPVRSPDSITKRADSSGLTPVSPSERPTYCATPRDWQLSMHRYFRPKSENLLISILQSERFGRAWKLPASVESVRLCPSFLTWNTSRQYALILPPCHTAFSFSRRQQIRGAGHTVTMNLRTPVYERSAISSKVYCARACLQCPTLRTIYGICTTS
ncbi:hypothetical protein RvY_15686-1 [Ramazzottius varieornatus]|uniref:Uncharacterized protein n=1 Tax=Ramazzottius varieornatus TaxID=947166 RepID=A0A1D1VWY5_RAMVA|nr:hypothetical protein RvY_15686-1 [Ramazzottius varieornatus]